LGDRKAIQPVKSTTTTVFLAHHYSMVAACCIHLTNIVLSGGGEWYEGMSSCTGPLQPKNWKKILKDTAKKRIKIKKYKGSDALSCRCLLSDCFCSAWAGFFDLTGPAFSVRIRWG